MTVCTAAFQPTRLCLYEIGRLEAGGTYLLADGMCAVGLQSVCILNVSLQNNPMRFSLLHHTDWPGHADHYDLLLQDRIGVSDDDPVLKTWSTECGILRAEDELGIPAVQQPDHRRFYLDYEGPVSGGRGLVSRLDSGKLLWLPAVTENGLLEFRFRLEGKRLLGIYALVLQSENRYMLQKSK